MAEFHFQPFHVCFVGKSESLPLCLCTVVVMAVGRTGVIVASQLFCSMLGIPDVQREKGCGGGQLPEMPALREGNQSFAVTFYLPVPPGWRERRTRRASSC